ncbi:MAG: hypothetical protein QXS37_04550 [Candidatus Aenigmatarchaeota archaeon]
MKYEKEEKKIKKITLVIDKSDLSHSLPKAIARILVEPYLKNVKSFITKNFFEECEKISKIHETSKNESKSIVFENIMRTLNINSEKVNEIRDKIIQEYPKYIKEIRKSIKVCLVALQINANNNALVNELTLRTVEEMIYLLKQETENTIKMINCDG